ncbi:hypothetical protein [Curtobacterium sp. MCBD17_040]|uniref:hypothetical protein n=1 Tax=Curtobacterium sp. MCBD17_040 TaxID=2175674 RepID=UPI000DA87075|nr:hypothetical protein [Curtobacterium sp. MCBD17_040]WIB65492.1 hypothetical protein DEI94_19150 [Curtobacterium sp. MCBD17_040]
MLVPDVVISQPPKQWSPEAMRVALDLHAFLHDEGVASELERPPQDGFAAQVERRHQYALETAQLVDIIVITLSGTAAAVFVTAAAKGFGTRLGENAADAVSRIPGLLVEWIGKQSRGRRTVLDVYDEDGRPLGKVASRDIKPARATDDSSDRGPRHRA